MPDSPDDVPNERSTIHLLRATALQLNSLASDFARRNQLNATDVRALIGLLDRERGGLTATPGWLGAHLGINSASVTALVDRLSERGFVERTRDDVDRRRVVLQVTDTARNLGEQFFGPTFGRVGDVSARYSSSEIAVVERFLGDVIAALTDID